MKNLRTIVVATLLLLNGSLLARGGDITTGVVAPPPPPQGLSSPSTPDKSITRATKSGNLVTEITLTLIRLIAVS
jgi:hypothetical protein